MAWLQGSRQGCSHRSSCYILAIRQRCIEGTKVSTKNGVGCYEGGVGWSVGKDAQPIFTNEVPYAPKKTGLLEAQRPNGDINWMYAGKCAWWQEERGDSVNAVIVVSIEQMQLGSSAVEGRHIRRPKPLQSSLTTVSEWPLPFQTYSDLGVHGDHKNEIQYCISGGNYIKSETICKRSEVRLTPIDFIKRMFNSSVC